MTIAIDAESRLAARERTIARLQALARAASWTLDPWTGEAEWSDDMFALFGLDRSAAPSFDAVAAMLKTPHRDRWRQAFAEACRSRPVNGVECEIRQPSGECRRIRLYIAPEAGKDGRVARLCGICQDVTDEGAGAAGPGEPATALAEQVKNLLMVVIDNVDYARDVAGAEEHLARALKTASEAAKLTLDLASPRDGAVSAQSGGAAGEEARAEPAAWPPAVLVVDDEPALRKLVRTMIETLGYGVVEAECADDALQVIAERADVTLVVCDLVMTGMDGAELAAQALKSRPGLKILLASGFDGPELDSAARLGGVDIIAKPFTRAALAAKVRQALAPAQAA